MIADSGMPSPTHETVGAVRRRREADPERYDGYFDAISNIVREARRAIETGRSAALGPLFDRNHMLLQAIGVSTPRLDQLVLAARNAGALGAKLSGGGGGGNIIALVESTTTEMVGGALHVAGAVRIVTTTIAP